jgi:hypothetical protein
MPWIDWMALIDTDSANATTTASPRCSCQTPGDLILKLRMDMCCTFEPITISAAILTAMRT